MTRAEGAPGCRVHSAVGPHAFLDLSFYKGERKILTRVVEWEAFPDVSQSPSQLPLSNSSASCVSRVLPEPIQRLFFPTVQSNGLQGIIWDPATRPQRGEVGEGGKWAILTCENDHVHPPKYTHNPANHHDRRQDLNQSSSNVQPEDTTHVPVGEVGPGSAQHGESGYKRA